MTAAMASPWPVLPEVGSTIVPPGLRSPFSSAASIIRTPMRSFTLPPGFSISSLARMVGFTPAMARWSRTSGVFPIASRKLSRTLIPETYSRPARAREASRSGQDETPDRVLGAEVQAVIRAGLHRQDPRTARVDDRLAGHAEPVRGPPDPPGVPGVVGAEEELAVAGPAQPAPPAERGARRGAGRRGPEPRGGA